MDFNKLYNNDVLEVLKSIPDSSLDMVYEILIIMWELIIMAQNIHKNGKIILNGIVN